MNDKFTPSEHSYISQFKDNPKCLRAIQLAMTHLDINDEVNQSLLKRLVYVASVAAQSVDDDVFICSMLHPLAEYKYTELTSILAGFDFETTKVVQALRETHDVAGVYTRCSGLDTKYLAVVMARVMYRLSNIELYEYDEAESIINEATMYTSKIAAPYDIKVHFEVLLKHATSVYKELHDFEYLEDSKEDTEVDAFVEEVNHIAHKVLADELGVIHKQVIVLPGIGEVTYHNCIGFCDSTGSIVNLEEHAKDTQSTAEVIVDEPEDTIDLSKANAMDLSAHHRVANLMKIPHGYCTNIINVGKVTYDSTKGFLKEDGTTIELSEMLI